MDNTIKRFMKQRLMKRLGLLLSTSVFTLTSLMAQEQTAPLKMKFEDPRLSQILVDGISEARPVKPTEFALDNTRGIGYRFYSDELEQAGGLPAGKTLTASSGTKFLISPATGKNMLSFFPLWVYQMPDQVAKITFEENKVMSKVHILGTATNGDAVLEVAALFAGEQNPVRLGSARLKDWSGTTGAVTGLGRIHNNGTIDASKNFRLTEVTFDIPEEHKAKKVEMLRVEYRQRDNRQVTMAKLTRPYILALSRTYDGNAEVPEKEVKVSPIAFSTEFNTDVIAEVRPAKEANYTKGLGLDGDDRLLYTNAVAPTGSVPAGATIVSKDGEKVTYQLKSATEKNGIILTKDIAEKAMSLATPQAYSKLYVLGIGGNGSSSVKLKAVFEDDSEAELGSVKLKDWFGSNEAGIGYTGLGRIQPNEEYFFDVQGFRLSEGVITLSAEQAKKKIKTIKFTSAITGGERAVIFAVSGAEANADNGGAQPQGDTFKVSAYKDGYSTITITGADDLTKVAKGTKLQVTAKMDAPNQVIKNFLINDVKQNTAVINKNTYTQEIVVDKDMTISVEFFTASIIWETITPQEGGTVTYTNVHTDLVPGGKVLFPGEVVTIEATPATNYRLKSIKVDDVDVTATKSFTVEKEGNYYSIKVEFELNADNLPKVKLGTPTAEHGSVKFKDIDPEQELKQGTEVTIETTPDTGYELESVRVNGKVISAPYKFKVTGQNNVVVTFKKKRYPFFQKIMSHGKIEFVGTSGYADFGQELSVLVTPDNRYKLTSLTYKGKDIMDTKKFVVEDGKGGDDIVATFEKVQYKVVVKAVEHGTITYIYEGKEDNAELEFGQEITVIATPDAGYTLTELTVNGYDIKYSKTFFIDEQNIVEGVFAKATAIDELEALSLAVYPNPASKFIVVKGEEPKAILKIYSLNGALVFTHQIQSYKETIALPQLPQGVYLVKVGKKQTKLHIK